MGANLHFGKHWMRLEGDTLCCKYVGIISLPDVQVCMQALDKMLLKGTTYYILADVAEVTGMEAAARKLSTDWYARHDIGGAVNFGAGALTCAIGALILSLLRLLHKYDLPTYFVKSEADGRAWIEEQRRRRAAMKQSK